MKSIKLEGGLLKMEDVSHQCPFNPSGNHCGTWCILFGIEHELIYNPCAGMKTTSSIPEKEMIAVEKVTLHCSNRVFYLDKGNNI